LPELGWAIMAGVSVIGWRLTVDPGLDWSLHESAPLWQVLLVYLGPIAAFLAARTVLRGLPRVATEAFLLSGTAAASALLADILLIHWLGDDMASHTALSTLALPWLLLALGQLYRLRLGGALQKLRIGLALLAGGLAVLGLTLSLIFNPVATGEAISGPPVFDALFASYLLPGLCLVLARPFLDHLPALLRRGLALVGLGFAALYLALEIRRFWRGDVLSVPGTSQPELYSYTLALLLLGAVLLWQALVRRSQSLWRMAMGAVVLAIAKVYLLDAAGLTGLTRVFSFLLLGLMLVGLVWLNRLYKARTGPDRTPPL
jgi:uncharacterized membrane protein